MKKRKAIEDSELKKASGGVHEKDYPVSGEACIEDPSPKYQYIDQSGNYVGEATTNLDELLPSPKKRMI